jgi:hypothetical protein
VTTCRAEPKLEPAPDVPASWQRLRNRCGALLVALGVLWAAAIVLTSHTDVFVAHPMGLVPVALWTAWPHRRPALRQLQDVAFLYLVLLPVLAAALVFWEVPGLLPQGGSVRISAAWGSLVVMGAGRLLQARGRPHSVLPTDEPLFWAAGVFLFHGILLALLLSWCYGYGCRLDMEVAGRVGLCILVAVLLVPLSHERLLRVPTCLAMAAFLMWKY